MILKFESDRQNCQILHKKYVYNSLAVCKQRLSLSLGVTAFFGRKCVSTMEDTEATQVKKTLVKRLLW